MIRRKQTSHSNLWEQCLCLTVGVNNYCKDCCVCVCSGRRSRSNLCVSGCRLCLCHSASHVEFTAPFGTAKKGKAAQVREVQPIAADPSSCSRPSRRWHATQHTPPAVARNVSVGRLSHLLQQRDWRNDASVSEQDELRAIKENKSFGRCGSHRSQGLHVNQFMHCLGLEHMTSTLY